MPQPAQPQQVSVTINGVTVLVPHGIYSFDDAVAFLGISSATKKLTVTDVAARNGAVLTGNMSVRITGGETITSA